LQWGRREALASVSLLFFVEVIMPTTDEVAQFMMNKLKEQFKDTAQGAAEDVDAFFAELSGDYTQACMIGDQDLVDEIVSQLFMLAEKHRLTFVGNSFASLGMVLQGVAGIIIRFLI
jgi:hypothetical protein